MTKIFLLFFLSFLLTDAFAESLQKDCPQFFAGGRPPLDESAVTIGLCYRRFAVLYSKDRKTPIFSAERIEQDDLSKMARANREGDFHVEKRIPRKYRSHPDDYTNSGYDRGHMTPAGDMVDSASMRESFSMANMVPQSPDNNQVAWRSLETLARDSARAESGPTFVISGPSYTTTPETIKNGVAVPYALFKATYQNGKIQIWWIENKPGATAEVISRDELRRRLGFDAFR